MRLGNPLRDESAAFRLVLLTLVALGLVVVASKLATWLGLVVLVAELLVGGWLVAGAYGRHRARSAPVTPGPEDRAQVSDTTDDPSTAAHTSD
jgi:hypothetical protein